MHVTRSGFELAVSQELGDHAQALAETPAASKRIRDGDYFAADTLRGVSVSVSRLSHTPSAATFTESRASWA